jgi:hypothetical protein
MWKIFCDLCGGKIESRSGTATKYELTIAKVEVRDDRSERSTPVREDEICKGCFEQILATLKKMDKG